MIPQTEYDLCESKFACVGIIMHCAKSLNNVKHEPIDRNHEQKSVEKPKFNSNYFASIFLSNENDLTLVRFVLNMH